MTKTTLRTRTRDRELTREQVRTALTKVDLTPEEEIVVRLRYGLPLSPSTRLSFRGQGNEELKARLALMEKAILDSLEDDAGQVDEAVLDGIKDL